MPAAYLYAFISGNPVPIPVKCDSQGRLIVDPSLLFENPPTEDETKKAPTSEWAYDHAANANAHHTPPVAGDFDHNDLANIGTDDHHAKYTDAEARAAINNILSQYGYLNTYLNCNCKALTRVKQFELKWVTADNFSTSFISVYGEATIRIIGGQSGVGNVAANLEIYDGSDYQEVPHLGRLLADISSVFGTLYWSCAGTHFDASDPSNDDITKQDTGVVQANADGITLVASVHLPDGATVTGVEVYGNAAAAAESWSLIRYALDQSGSAAMASENINTEDTSISNAVIDNSAYIYVLATSSIDTNDQVYSARISYTLPT